jgi:cysteine desulfurase
MKRIYLDYAASTPVEPAVMEAMRPYFSEKFGNAGSLHSFGQEAQAAIDKSRETIAKAIGADFREMIFTGSATEANNLALRGVIKAVRQFSRGTGCSSAPAAEAALNSRSDDGRLKSADQPHRISESFRSRTAKRPRIIVSSIEHESVLETAKDLEKDGVEVLHLPVDRGGYVVTEKLKELLNERTILVSVMYVNNEIGAVQSISQIVKIVDDFRNRKIDNKHSATNKNGQMSGAKCQMLPLVHTDAVQAFQFFDCDVRKLGIDLMTLSAHKIYGPKGIGVLYIRNSKLETRNSKQTQNSNVKTQTGNASNLEFRVSAVITGGRQEFGLRSGTENVPAIVGFSKAVELVSNSRELENKRVCELKNYFWKELKKVFPNAAVNGLEPEVALGQLKSAPHILNVYLPGELAQDLLIKFDLAGVAVSSGAACSARSSKPSHVLLALGLPIERVRASLRFSFGKPTKITDLKRVVGVLRNILL